MSISKTNLGKIKTDAERLAALEKEVAYLRVQLEMANEREEARQTGQKPWRDD